YIPKGLRLSEEERVAILAFHKAEWSIRRIAKELMLSHGAVRRLMREPELYGTLPRGGSQPKLNIRDQRTVLPAASKGDSSSSRLKHDLQLEVSARTVRRLLAKSPHPKYKKRKPTPKLTAAHKLARVVWAKSLVDLGLGWNQVVFSDEEKFNLDGPDGLPYYCHDLRKEEQTFLSRQNGGGSVMIWAGFSSKGLTEVAVLEGRQNSFVYSYTLTNYLMPFAHASHPDGYVFQQDNASIHTSQESKAFLAEQDIPLLG
ncbi:hypothetical protein DYB31_004309, partial [Aphanomyces astaci]